MNFWIPVLLCCLHPDHGRSTAGHFSTRLWIYLMPVCNLWLANWPLSIGIYSFRSSLLVSHLHLLLFFINQMQLFVINWGLATCVQYAHRPLTDCVQNASGFNLRKQHFIQKNRFPWSCFPQRFFSHAGASCFYFFILSFSLSLDVNHTQPILYGDFWFQFHHSLIWWSSQDA